MDSQISIETRPTSGTTNPFFNTACQALLAQQTTISGWLRKPSLLHKCGSIVENKINRSLASITSKIPWERRYVVFLDGYVIVYKNETSSKPVKVVDLVNYRTVERTSEVVKDVPWPFRILSDSSTTLQFGATSKEELTKWIAATEKAMTAAVESGRKRDADKNSEKPEDEDYEDPDEEDLVLYDEIPDSAVTHETKQNNNEKSRHRDQMPLPVPPTNTAGAEYELGPRLSNPPKGQNNSARKGIPAPAMPTNIKDARGNQKPAVPLKKTASLSSTCSTSSSASSSSTLLSPISTKPAPPIPPVKGPQFQKAAADADLKQDDDEYVDDVDVEYEMPEPLLNDALWKGLADEGLEIMKTISEEGTFMIRQSSTGEGDTLIVVVGKILKKYKINLQGEKYVIAGIPFNNMMELIEYYRTNFLPNQDIKLAKPYKKAMVKR